MNFIKKNEEFHNSFFILLKNKNIILDVCGCVAVYKSRDVIRQLASPKANVECILTKNAHQFIAPLTLQTLSKSKIHKNMFKYNGSIYSLFKKLV